MVEDVAQFSVRGGIFDIYSFGMAEAGTPRVLGRRYHRSCATSISIRSAARAMPTFALILPVDGRVQAANDTDERVTLP
ncbi:hypothetical protein [Gemmatimonas sp.]|uniref:hypothetical protein n=1 Tax=Gemmatimonas sp. TaxID=1962908 RepID=UPI003DA3344A